MASNIQALRYQVQNATTKSAVLGLTSSSAEDPKHVKAAYRSLALQLHPDKCQDPTQLPLHNLLFQKVQAAYEGMCKDIARKERKEQEERTKSREERTKRQEHTGRNRRAAGPASPPGAFSDGAAYEDYIYDILRRGSERERARENPPQSRYEKRTMPKGYGRPAGYEPYRNWTGFPESLGKRPKGWEGAERR